MHGVPDPHLHSDSIMQVQQGFQQPSAYRGGFVSIGNFDGVHRGHQRMLAALVARARRDNVPAVVLTFDPPPVELLAPGRAPPRLCTLERKAELLAVCGVDCLIVYPTIREFLQLTPEEFFARIVCGELQARGLVEGPNFFFGRDRAGNVRTLGVMCATAGLSLEVVEAVTWNGQNVSSSAVRRAVGCGRIEDAAEMLGCPYRVTGCVASGAGRGRVLGFPTANLTGVSTLLPPDGVYAGVAIPTTGLYPAAIHLGPNPTFGEGARKLEVFLLDYEGDLYNQPLSIDLLTRLRDVASFSDATSLQRQIQEDVRQVRARVERHWWVDMG